MSKQSHGNPIRLEDLAIHSKVEALTTNHELYQSFKAHERVIFDEKTGLYSYKVSCSSYSGFVGMIRQ